MRRGAVLLKASTSRQAQGRELSIDGADGLRTARLLAAMARAGFPKLATGRNWSTVLKLATATRA